jgi:hypothetical protein
VSLVDRFVLKYNRLPTERDPDYLEMLRMSKYRILTRPDVGPNAKCANCGSSREDERLYVDFGLQIDWYGPVYLCTICLRDIAYNAKLFRALEIHILKLEEEIAELKLQRVSAKELKETVLKTYEEVRSYFDNLSATGNDPASGSRANVGTRKESSSSITGKSDSGAVKPESGITESAAKSGPENIPSLKNLLGA